MVKKSSHENLALLIALQMLGFIVLEVMVWVLVAIGVLPPLLTLSHAGGVVIQVNSAYIVIAGLMSILVAGFWLALLAEVFDLIEINDVKIKF